MNDTLLADAIEQLLDGQCGPAVVREIESGASCATLWSALEQSGFCDALVPEAQGGAGLGLADVRALLETCGRHALPLPLAQTMLARALLAGAGHSAPAGAIALATATGGDAVHVVQGAVANWLLLAQGDALTLVDLDAVDRRPVGHGSLDAYVGRPSAGALTFESGVDLGAQLALLLSVQMAGSMRRVFAMTLQYANERVQFGRSIGKFQAIQHQLAVMAEHMEAASMGARVACSTGSITADPLACALAKASAASAVVPIASIAHAVHGAIGITHEYDLQLHTRRLQAWRLAGGGESYWNERVGRALLKTRDLGLDEFVRTALATPA